MTENLQAIGGLLIVPIYNRYSHEVTFLVVTTLYLKSQTPPLPKMVISDKYKYVFIEHSRSASTAIVRELVKKYEGRKILFKHASYHDFLKSATEEQKTYFIFSTLRHPMDIVVSDYTKLKNDHKGQQTNRNWKRKNRGKLRVFFSKVIDSVMYRFITRKDANFARFFKKFYYLPFTDWSMIAHHKFDYIIRFENLQSNFSDLLKKLNIEQVRDIQMINASGKERSFLDYYDESCIRRAQFVFGPYCKHWGYKLPESWNHEDVSFMSSLLFKTSNMVFRFYYFYLR